MHLVKRYRRVMTVFMLALVATTIVSAAPSQAQEETDVEALLATSATTLAELDSFHFLITTPVGKTLMLGEAELTSIEGDVVRPMSFQAQFTVGVGFASLTLEAVGIDDQLWVSNPMAGGEFMLLEGVEGQELPPLTLLNPDQLIQQAVSLIEEPAITGSDDLGGVQTTVVTGSFDPGSITFDGTPVVEDVTGDLDPLQVTLWIDPENRVVQAEFAGALLPWEQGKGRIVRRIELSGFDLVPAIDVPHTAG
ncbi:MAG: LppX_LprAFG lipoprotein [Thermomicrobiales bacterium]